MSKIIVIDFDGTLFNTPHFKSDVIGIMSSFGVSEQKQKEVEQDLFPSGEYNLFVHLMKMAGDFNLDLVEIKQKIDHLFSHARGYLYEDSVCFLNKMQELGNFVIIYSYGNEEFQRQKIDATGLTDLVDEVHITQNSVKTDVFEFNFSKDLNKIIFIDDNTDALGEVINKFPEVKCIRMKRPKSQAFASEINKKVSKVNSLNQVLEII